MISINKAEAEAKAKAKAKAKVIFLKDLHINPLCNQLYWPLLFSINYLESLSEVKISKFAPWLTGINQKEMARYLRIRL